MKHAILLTVAAALLAAGCGSAAAGGGPRNDPAPLPAALARCPSGAPLAVNRGISTTPFVHPGAKLLRLCHYAGPLTERRPRLVRARLVRNGATIAALIRRLDSLRRVTGGPYPCPTDDGNEILLVFGYSGRQPQRVIVELSGCRFATNGRDSRWTTASFRSKLLALVSHG